MRHNFLTNYFGFNKQQRNGLFVLILISLGLLAIRMSYPLFITPDNITLKALPLLEKRLDSAVTHTKQFTEKNRAAHEDHSAALFVFDPNVVSLEQLKQLGVKEKTAQALIKFRSKGFVYKKKEDLRKVYGISDVMYARLEPYIVITNNVEPSHNHAETEHTAVAQKEAAHSISKVELNTADSSSLISLDGIGAGYARRILKYRTMLGGFISIEQLKEVYGLNESVYEKIKPSVFVEVKNIRKINLNTDDFKTLNKHPYLSYELTKTIFDWRRKTNITTANLKDILNDPALYARLMPYLSFD